MGYLRNDTRQSRSYYTTSTFTRLSSITAEVLIGIPPAVDWKRPLDRPRKTWLQQLEEDTGLSLGTAEFVSLDRKLWVLLRPSLVERSSG